jgi:hypothetical protein
MKQMPPRVSYKALLTVTVLLGSGFASPAVPAEGVAVAVTNASEPALCAEKDNVTLTLASAAVRRFRIEAAHPAYIGGLNTDRRDPDWTDCHDISAETSSAPPLRRVTFYEDADIRLTGYAHANFWRPADVPFRVGERVEHGLNLVQLWVRRDGRAEEVLVIYPADGYWRIRPLPPAQLGESAYGSSFLVGPVETERRPFVGLKDIAFDPGTMTFTLGFARGGTATVRLDALDRARLAVETTFDPPVSGAPFAALRSMYVAEANADAARVAVRELDGDGWREKPIMHFRHAAATDVWAGRITPSRHNASAPDLMFHRFEATPAGSEAASHEAVTREAIVKAPVSERR